MLKTFSTRDSGAIHRTGAEFWNHQQSIKLMYHFIVKSSGYFRLYVTSHWRAPLRYSVKIMTCRLLISVQNHEDLINNTHKYARLFFKHFLYWKKIIFQIDAENFNAKFWVVLKMLQVINSPKYVGITENYLCIHRVRKAPRWSRAGCDIALVKRISKLATSQLMRFWYLSYGPPCEKICLLYFWQSETQTSLLSYRD